MPARIEIDAETFDVAKSLARETYARFSQHLGHYDNSANNHWVGKLGELACALWAADMGFCCDQAFRVPDRMNEADLILILGAQRLVRIEVKSGSSHLWEPFGRCVSVGQMQGVCVKADFVLWCTVTPLSDVSQGSECSVQVEGWNTPTEIAEIPPILTGPAGRQRWNHQVPMEQVRPLRELVARLRGEP